MEIRTTYTERQCKEYAYYWSRIYTSGIRRKEDEGGNGRLILSPVSYTHLDVYKRQMQRGGSPTCKDRVYASMMGAMAADLLCDGKTNRVVGYQHGRFQDFDINEALDMVKGIDPYQYQVAKDLSKHC